MQEYLKTLSEIDALNVEGEVEAVREGSVVLFPQGAVHMLHNTGAEEMKVVCFWAPPTNLENYRMFEDVDFPD